MSIQARPSGSTKARLQVLHMRMHALTAPAQIHHSMTSTQERSDVASAAHRHAVASMVLVADAWCARVCALRRAYHKQSCCSCACLCTMKGPLAVSSQRPAASHQGERSPCPLLLPHNNRQEDRSRIAPSGPAAAACQRTRGHASVQAPAGSAQPRRQRSAAEQEWEAHLTVLRSATYGEHALGASAMRQQRSWPLGRRPPQRPRRAGQPGARAPPSSAGCAPAQRRRVRGTGQHCRTRDRQGLARP